MAIPLIILRGDTPRTNALEVTKKKLQRELRAGREFASPLFIRSPTDLSKSHVQVGGMSAGAKVLISAIHSDFFDLVMVSGGRVSQNETEAIGYMLEPKLVSEGKHVDFIGGEDSILDAMKTAYNRLGSEHHVSVVAGDIPDVIFQAPKNMNSLDAYMNLNSFENIYSSPTKYPRLGAYPRYPTALFEDEQGYHRVKEQNGLELLLNESVLQRSEVVMSMRKGEQSTMITYLKDTLKNPAGALRTAKFLAKQPVPAAQVLYEIASTKRHNKLHPDNPKEYFDIMHIPLDESWFSDLAWMFEQLSFSVDAKNTAIGNMADIDTMLDGAYHNAVVQTDAFHPLREVFSEYKESVLPGLERAGKVPTQQQYADMFNQRAEIFNLGYGFDSAGKLRMDDFYKHSGIDEERMREYIDLRDESFNRYDKELAPVYEL